MCELGKLADIIHVRPGDADIEKHRVVVAALLLQQVFEIRADRGQRFRKPWLFVDAVDREVDRSETGIAEAVDHVRFHQAAVRRQIDHEVLLRGVIYDLVYELRTQ